MYKPAPIVFALLLAIFPAGRSLADFTDGLEAYNAADYATACDAWLPLARAGDTGAQVAMAGLFYRSGPGTRRNAVQAAHWYRRAAESGDAVAQLNLAEPYEFGRGVAHDSARAMFWLSLAAAQGNGWAVARRQSLTAGLPGEARDRADRMLADWRASHRPDCRDAAPQVFLPWPGELTIAIAACYVICGGSSFSAGYLRSSKT